MEDVIKKNLETIFSLAAVTYSMCDDSTNPLYTQILEKVMNDMKDLPFEINEEF